MSNVHQHFLTILVRFSFNFCDDFECITYLFKFGKSGFGIFKVTTTILKMFQVFFKVIYPNNKQI